MSQLIPDDVSLFLRWVIAFGLLSARYLLFAGLAYLVFYVFKRREWLFMKIQQRFPDRAQVLHEMKYSFLTFLVFASVVVLIRFLSVHNILHTQIYRHFSDHSLLYYVLTTVFVIFFHDTYFYWAHRFMHHPFLYRHVHMVHHLSKDPTPWAAFAFHPLEALVEIGFVPILIFTIPLHFTSLLFLSLWMIFYNVLGHLGYEVFPRFFIRNGFFRWLNTSTNHNMHHRYVTCNYGLYFNIWDYFMSTNHAQYVSTFDAVTTRRQEGFAKLRKKEEEIETEPAMDATA